MSRTTKKVVVTKGKGLANPFEEMIEAKAAGKMSARMQGKKPKNPLASVMRNRRKL